jgi:flagellar basal-body rod modification protein FlgD
MNMSDISALSHIIRTAASNSSTGTSPTSANDTANTTLDGDSFITLLTAQLQAQDPLNPMDPDQMVAELVSLNSLQQLIEIQQDLSGGASGGSGNNGGGVLSLVQPQAPSQTVTPSPTFNDVVMQQGIFPAIPPASLE